MDMPKLFVILSLWIFKSLAILLTASFSFETIVLGNDKVMGSMTAVFLGLLLMLADFSVDPISKRLGIDVKDRRVRTGIYFLLCVLVVWIIKTLSVFTGLGISNNFVVLVIAGVAVLVDRPFLRIIKLVKLEG